MSFVYVVISYTLSSAHCPAYRMRAVTHVCLHELACDTNSCLLGHNLSALLIQQLFTVTAVANNQMLCGEWAHLLGQVSTATPPASYMAAAPSKTYTTLMLDDAVRKPHSFAINCCVQ